MASIGVTQYYGGSYVGFFGYGNGNYTYGYYNVSFCYDSISHSGDTITISNAYVYMQNPNSGYTTNTVYVDSVYVNGTSIGISGNAKGNTSYHTWSTGKVSKSVTVSMSASSCTVTVYCHRTGQNSGAQALSGTLSFGTGTLWNEINVFNPGGAQDYASGYFDLYISNNGTTYYNLTNETDTTQPYGTYFEVYNIRPYYDYYELSSVDGYDSIPSTGHYRKTFDTPNECLNIYMKYKKYYRDINAWNPTGTTQGALLFDLTIKDRNGNVVDTYYNCTNEPTTASVTREYGYTGTISNIRSNLAGAYYSSNNITGTAASSFSWTYNTTTSVELYTTYYDYSLTIDPNGGSYEGSTSSVTKTQKFNTTYTLSRPTKQGYVFSHWSASRGSNFDQYGLSCNTYNNLGNGTVTLTWLQSEASSGTNADVLQIVTNGTASPGAGGFYQAFQTEASHTYLQTYRLKVPVGYTVSYANNAMGDGAVVRKLTSMNGTGDWKTYVFEMTAGSSGTFSTSGFIYLNGTDNTSVTWYMAQAQVWDVTAGVYKANSNGIYRFDYATSNCTLTANWARTSLVKVNVDGVWKDGIAYVNVNGVWKQADSVYINVNGNWKIAEG